MINGKVKTKVQDAYSLRSTPQVIGAVHDALNYAISQIEIELKILDGIVVDVGFTGVGCAISKSSASMMTEEIKGKELEVVESMFEQFRRMITVNDQMDLDADLLGDLEILQGVSRYPARIKCATLAWHTLHSAIEGDENTVTTE